MALGLADSSYTASTVYGGWAAETFKIDASLGWRPEPFDVNPWIQVDLLNTYTIVGFYLQSNYLITFNIKASVNGSLYEYIEKNIVAEPLGNALQTTYWFANAAYGRYWRIEPLTHISDTPMVKGDFFGFI